LPSLERGHDIRDDIAVATHHGTVWKRGNQFEGSVTVVTFGEARVGYDMRMKASGKGLKSLHTSGVRTRYELRILMRGNEVKEPIANGYRLAATFTRKGPNRVIAVPRGPVACLGVSYEVDGGHFDHDFKLQPKNPRLGRCSHVKSASE
jgi:hypothetical protein